MEEEIINIATLTIDSDKAFGTIEQTKKSIFDLQKANTDLRKEIQKNGDATGEQTKQFVENEAELKKLNAVYKEQQTAMNSLTLAQVQSSEALNMNSKSVAQANVQNRELIATRNQINATTEDGRKAIALINEKLDQNNNFIRENSSALEKQKQNVGNYTDSIKEAANNLNPLNGGMAGFIERSKEAGGAGNLAKQSLGGMASGFIGVTKAALGFILTPVGAFIAALVVVFTAIKAAMNRSEEATGKISKVFAAFSGILNIFLKALASLGNYWINSYVKILEKVGQTSEKVMKGISSGLKLLGFTSAAKSVDNFTNSTKASIKASQDLAVAEKELEKSQRKARLTQLTYQKEAEKFRQIRDDENRTIAERITANDQLGATLKKQLRDELAIAQMALRVANLRIQQEGRTKETLDAQAQSLTEIADIQERITGQESEQLANRVSLQKEAAAKAKEAADQQKENASKALEAATKNKELEISILRSKNDLAKKTDEERITFINDITAKELELLKFKRSKGLITEKEFQLASLELLKTQSDETLAVAEATITKEIEAQGKVFEEKKKLSEQEKTDLLGNAEFLKQEQTRRIEESLLSERDKALALEEIQTGYLTNVAIINENFKAAEKQRADMAKQEAETLANAAFEMKLLGLEKEGQLESELQKAILTAQLEEKKRLLDVDLANEKKTAEEVRALKELEDKKYAAATKKIDKEIANAKRANATSMVKDSLNAAAAIFGENKAVAVAMALVNTYEGIAAGVKLGYPAAIPAVASAAATGFAAVKNILKTDKGTTSGAGGSGGGSSSLSTPTAVFDNPARTQTIAKLQDAPQTNNTPTTVPVLVLESLDEVKGQQQIKIKSN